ncbi:MAG: hypothetical protein EZS28_041272, partial [Streblomastix strix]
AGGGDMLLSAFGGLELVNINYTSNVVSPTSIMSLKCYRYGSLISHYGYIYMGIGAGASGASVAVCTLESAGFPKYLFYANDIVFAGSAPHVANFRFGTDGKVTITIKALTGTAAHIIECDRTEFDNLKGRCVGSSLNRKRFCNLCIDEALLDAARLMDFPELYAYIKERDPKPHIETAPQVPVGEQTLQEQVKINADIIENSNEVFVPPEPNMPVKIDYGQQIVNKPFIFNEMQPTLIVYGDRVTLNCFVIIKQQFKGYAFNSYPQEAQPKDNIKIITVICNSFSNNINLFCYIDENGPYVYAQDDREIAANTSIVISTTYYKQFEALKQINYDSNNDGKVDIMDVWNGSGQGTHPTQSHMYDVVKKQSDLVDHHIEGTVLYNFLNNDIKLIDKLGIYKAERTAYYILDGPIVTFSFGAKLGDNIGNDFKSSSVANQIKKIANSPVHM